MHCIQRLAFSNTTVLGLIDQIIGDGPVSSASVPSAGNVCVYSLDA